MSRSSVSSRVGRSAVVSRTCRTALAVVGLFFFACPAYSAWVSNVSGSPNPNITGNYTVTWDSNPQLLLHLQENVNGTGSWTTVASNYSGTHSITGKLPNNYLYRVKYSSQTCVWVNGERECTTTTNI